MGGAGAGAPAFPAGDSGAAVQKLRRLRFTREGGVPARRRLVRSHAGKLRPLSPSSLMVQEGPIFRMADSA